MSESSGGPGPPNPFNLYNVLHRNQMPTLHDSVKFKKNHQNASFFTHPKDSEKYFVLSGESVRQMDVFEIQESLELISKEEFKQCTRLKSGDILVQTANPRQIDALKSTNTIGVDKKPLEISENGVLNQSQATIICSKIANVKMDRVIEKLTSSSQNIIAVERLKRKVDNVWIDTNTYLITFNVPIIPAEVRVGYIHAPTQLYIPSPFRCVICQKLGHTKKRCDPTKYKPACGFCAVDHGPEFSGKCPASTPKCVNCHGIHPSFSHKCPKFMIEKQINVIRVTERIPYGLAREEHKKRYPQFYVQSTATNVSTSTAPAEYSAMLSSSASQPQPPSSTPPEVNTTSMSQPSVLPPSKPSTSSQSSSTRSEKLGHQNTVKEKSTGAIPKVMSDPPDNNVQKTAHDQCDSSSIDEDHAMGDPDYYPSDEEMDPDTVTSQKTIANLSHLG
ncbi:hypothetical protein DMENIID0001_100680 [Sergentomyia squamirostris]